MPEVTVSGENDSQYFIYVYQNYVKKAFVEALRTAFSHYTTPDIYRYDKDMAKSQVDIRIEYPQVIAKKPIIIVNTGGGSADVTYLGDEFARKVLATEGNYSEDGFLYTGKLTLNANIELYTDSRLDAEHISDLIIEYTRFLFRPVFASKNIAYTKISNGGIKQQDGMFTNTITVSNIICEFDHYIPQSMYDLINSIDFDVIASIEVGGV